LGPGTYPGCVAGHSWFIDRRGWRVILVDSLVI
jgi:hypothetical protein